MDREVVRYNGCFVCGPDNPIGLNLKFVYDGKICRTTYQPDTRHEGYKGILHGGILATILDEVMIKAALAENVLCVTASMEVRFKAPADIRSFYTFESRIVSRRGRIIATEGKAVDQSGTTVAEATGKYMTVSPDLKSRLQQSLDP